MSGVSVTMAAASVTMAGVSVAVYGVLMTMAGVSLPIAYSRNVDDEGHQLARVEEEINLKNKK